MPIPLQCYRRAFDFQVTNAKDRLKELEATQTEANGELGALLDANRSAQKKLDKLTAQQTVLACAYEEVSGVFVYWMLDAQVAFDCHVP